MKLFIKYFSLGLLGLVLQLAFPFLHIDFLVLVVGFAFLRGSLEIALISAAALALIFSAFTLANPLWLFLPLAGGVISFPFLQKNFSLSPRLDQAWLFFHLWLCQTLLGMMDSFMRTQHIGFSLPDIIWGAVTVLVGVGVLFFLPKQDRRSTGELDYFKARHSQEKKTPLGRRPFGWEEKI